MPAALLRSRGVHRAAFQTPQFGVQIRQGLFHQIPVPGILARFQFPKDPGARKIQSFSPSQQFQFLRWNLLIERRTDLSLGRVDLRLDRFTFPTSCHDSIIRCGTAGGVALFGRYHQNFWIVSIGGGRPQLVECGRMARAISPSPPTSSTSMTMVLNKLVG